MSEGSRPLGPDAIERNGEMPARGESETETTGAEHASAGRDALAAVTVWSASYLYGSLPVVYLLGARRALDLRAIGSGNVGATNLMAGGARALSVLGWVFDASKGYVPIAVARRLGLREDVAALAGVCGVAGQCWPVFLGFRGGRGISAFVGATSQMVDGPGWELTLAPLAGGGLWRVAGRFLVRAGGSRSRSVPFGCFLGIVAFPLIARWRARSRVLSRGPGQRHVSGAVVPLRSGSAPSAAVRGTRLASLLLSAILLVRRLTAPLPDDALVGPMRRPEALLFRLLYDRNTSR